MEILKREYPVGTVADVTVVGMTTFGAFARIIPGIDGLIHISQIADHRIEKPQDVLKIGDVVKAKITDIDFEKKRVSLSSVRCLSRRLLKKKRLLLHRKKLRLRMQNKFLKFFGHRGMFSPCAFLFL